jgi:hypothetical protein
MRNTSTTVAPVLRNYDKLRALLELTKLGYGTRSTLAPLGITEESNVLLRRHNLCPISRQSVTQVTLMCVFLQNRLI